MKKKIIFSLLLISSLMMSAYFIAAQVQAACRNPNSAEGGSFVTPVASSGKIEIKWFGHSFFQITSGDGTRIITDPFGAMGFPMPEVWPHVRSEEHTSELQSLAY